MKNVLIPTDFSNNAFKAIDYALNFFKERNCTFYLLNVSPIVNYASGDTPLIHSSQLVEKTLLEQSKRGLEKLLSKIEKKYPNIQHKFIAQSSYNYFIEAIRNQVIEKDIDLIIMGTKGASGLQEVIIGSHTGDVITKVKKLVLAIPEKASYELPKNIVFPTDFNTFYPSKILNTIIDFSKAHNSSIRILHVAKKDEALRSFQLENKEYLNDFFADIDHSFHRVTNKKIEAGLQCFVENRDIDMIIMIAKNLTLFQQIIFRPTVEEISYHTKVPFLVIHE